MEASIGRVGQRTPGGRTIHRAAIVSLARAGHVDPCSYQLILERFPLRDGDVWKSRDRDQRNCAKAKYTTPVHEDLPHMPMSINYATGHPRCPQWVLVAQKRFGAVQSWLPTGWRAPSSALIGFFCDRGIWRH